VTIGVRSRRGGRSKENSWHAGLQWFNSVEYTSDTRVVMDRAEAASSLQRPLRLEPLLHQAGRRLRMRESVVMLQTADIASARLVNITDRSPPRDAKPRRDRFAPIRSDRTDRAMRTPERTPASEKDVLHLNGLACRGG